MNTESIYKLEVNDSITLTEDGITIIVTRVDESEFDIDMESDDDSEFSTVESADDAIYYIEQFVENNC